MFWAVQGMAAELSTGVLVMKKIEESGASVSMLVAQNQARFTKKATGRITFSCSDGDALDAVLKEALESGEGQTLWMKSQGVDEQGNQVSAFEFEWTLKLRSK